MDTTASVHFSGLRFDDEYPAPTYKGACKVPFVIGVAGGTSSGKTTVCDMIIQQLHDHRVVLVNQDSFYRGLTSEEMGNVAEYNFDHPDAFDTEQLLECLGSLKDNQPFQVNASDVVVVEAYWSS